MNQYYVVRWTVVSRNDFRWTVFPSAIEASEFVNSLARPDDHKVITIAADDPYEAAVEARRRDRLERVFGGGWNGA